MCPRCDTPAAGEARFCSRCGAPLPAAGGREVRKTVTILFADVTGSTAIGERLDPEAFRRVIARYFDLARTVLERHGGTVEKFIGDAVMAVFGIPTLHEDDALRAVRAAVELRDGLDALGEELVRQFGTGLRIRTGIQTGEVVTGTAERLATGDAVNTAARLEQAAAPGEILIGEATYQLARGAIEAEPIDHLELKGKSQPVPAYRLTGVVEGAPAFARRFDSPLVGRDGPLAALAEAFAASRGERLARGATVVGPPGIGKSRLIREFEAGVQGEATTLAGACRPYGEGITYQPLVEIFRAADADAELAAALAAPAAEETFLAVRRALERRARERPLVLVVDDIHWAEPTLLDLLEHLVAWSRDAPMLILASARPELLDVRPGWGTEPGWRVIPLEPLDAAQADRLIDGLLGHTGLPAASRDRIRETADGNPLFVEQLLADIHDHLEKRELPATIQALLAARLDGLPEVERDVLERASVLGTEFAWDGLAALADGARPPGGRLATLVRKELIAPDPAIEDGFRFRHILIRDAAYARIPKELRADLHERAAAWLEGRGIEAEELVGYHLEHAYESLAALGPVSERATRIAERASRHLAASGRRAERRGDMRAASGLYDRALALLPDGDPAQVELLLAVARGLRETGRMGEAVDVLFRAVDRARDAGDRRALALAELNLALIRFMRPVQTGVRRADVLEILDRAVPVFTELHDDRGLGQALGIAGMLSAWKGDASKALADLEASARHARLADDRAQEVASLHYVAVVVERGPTPTHAALARLDEMADLAAQHGPFRVGVLVNRAALHGLRDDVDAARTLIAEARASAEDLGLAFIRDTAVAAAAGWIELTAGDPALAEPPLWTACDAWETAGELGYLSSSTPVLIEAILRQGRVDEAYELTERWRPERLTAPTDIDAQASWRRVRALVHARLGDLPAAVAVAREAWTLVAPTEVDQLRADVASTLAEVLALAGQYDEAHETRAEAIRLATHKGYLALLRRLRSPPA